MQNIVGRQEGYDEERVPNPTSQLIPNFLFPVTFFFLFFFFFFFCNSSLIFINSGLAQIPS